VIYNIYRSTTPDRELSDFAAPIASGVTGTSYTDRGLAPGWSYYYAVSATNSLGFEGLASTEAGATTRLGSLTITPQTLIQHHADGSIWQYAPHAGLWGSNWLMLDNNPATVDVVTDGTNLYQLHSDGSIWRYTGTPLTGWTLLDVNPATVQIAAGGGELHQRHRDGSIWQYEGPAILGWVELDANPATDLITVAT
jgi:hypothetical protein